jgi:hypothetical protein
MTLGVVVIGWNNLTDAAAAVVSANSEVASLPASNLQTADIREIWRSSAVGSNQAVKLDLGSQVTFQCGALINTNLAASDLFRVVVSTSDPNTITGVVYDSGASAPCNVDPKTGVFVHFFPAEVTGRYVQLQFDKPGVSVEAGRVFVGPIWLPSHNFQRGWSSTVIDPSRHTVSLGQFVYIDPMLTQRAVRGTLPALPVEEIVAQVENINLVCGIRRDLLICYDYGGDESLHTIWGLLENTINIPNTEFAHYPADISIRERL